MVNNKKTGKKKNRSVWAGQRNRVFLVWAIQIAVVLLLAFLFVFFFAQSVSIQENSMDPTIQAGDRVLINKAAYILGGVKRGDIIVYKSSESADAAFHVKRVIGLPGEKIQIKDGLILINGSTYMEDIELPNITDPGVAADGITLETNEYFVLGDNRNSSEDSRYADVGNIPKSNIKGRIWFIFGPSDRRGAVR